MDVFSELSDMSILLGEPARVLMLWNLMGGEARPAGELAFFANVSPQSASMHLAKLVEAGMLNVEKQGRHRYYSIAKPEVATFVESMSALLPSANRFEAVPRSQMPEFRIARTCYDHLAGNLAVGIVDAMKKQGILSAGKDEFLVPDKGGKWFREFGIDSDELRRQRRGFAKKCLDWSERQHHLAGALGAAFLKELLRRKWFAQSTGRALRVTLEGRRKLDEVFGIVT